MFGFWDALRSLPVCVFPKWLNAHKPQRLQRTWLCYWGDTFFWLMVIVIVDVQTLQAIMLILNVHLNTLFIGFANHACCKTCKLQTMCISLRWDIVIPLNYRLRGGLFSVKCRMAPFSTLVQYCTGSMWKWEWLQWLEWQKGTLLHLTTYLVFNYIFSILT